MMPPHSKSSFTKIQGQSSSSKTPRKTKKNKNKQSSISQNSISHHRRSRRRYSRNKRGRGENDFRCPICLVEFYRPPPPAEEERVVDHEENEEIFVDAQEPDYYVIIKLIGKLKRNADGTTETMCNHLIHDCCWTANVNITDSQTCPVCRADVERIEYYKGPVRYPYGVSRDQEYLTTGRPHRQPICGSRAVVDVLRDNTRVHTRVRAVRAVGPDEQTTFHPLPPPSRVSAFNHLPYMPHPDNLTANSRNMPHLTPENFRQEPY